MYLACCSMHSVTKGFFHVLFQISVEHQGSGPWHLPKSGWKVSWSKKRRTWVLGWMPQVKINCEITFVELTQVGHGSCLTSRPGGYLGYKFCQTHQCQPLHHFIPEITPCDSQFSFAWISELPPSEFHPSEKVLHSLILMMHSIILGFSDAIRDQFWVVAIFAVIFLNYRKSPENGFYLQGIHFYP